MSSEILIKGDGVVLEGKLNIPQDPKGLVLFTHGRGSSKRSPRNELVARTLNEAGLATVLIDLLTKDEELDPANVFDIDLLSRRLVFATRWAHRNSELAKLPIGFFGGSTGAAAALRAVGALGDFVEAVVSRGGRPDLAREDLPAVKCPTLLLAGGNDDVVLELNKEVLPLLPNGELIVVPGATHFFEEKGTLEQVATEATNWFTRFLGQRRAPKAA